MGRLLKLAAVIVFAVAFIALLLFKGFDVHGALVALFLGLALSTAGDVVE